MMFKGKTMRALLRLNGFTALCVLLIAAAPINLTTSDSPVADAAMQGEAYLFSERLAGPGGLPIGVEGRGQGDGLHERAGHTCNWNGGREQVFDR